MSTYLTSQMDWRILKNIPFRYDYDDHLISKNCGKKGEERYCFFFWSLIWWKNNILNAEFHQTSVKYWKKYVIVIVEFLRKMFVFARYYKVKWLLTKDRNIYPWYVINTFTAENTLKSYEQSFECCSSPQSHSEASKME